MSTSRIELVEKAFNEGTTASEFVEKADLKAMARSVAEVEFRAKNRRRHALIDKKFDAGLSAEEEVELGSLTAYVDEWVAKHHPLPTESIEDIEAKFARIRQRLEERRQAKACQ